MLTTLCRHVNGASQELDEQYESLDEHEYHAVLDNVPSFDEFRLFTIYKVFILECSQPLQACEETDNSVDN